jgi:glycosyltransferase involved in cell wall biosynthesis
MVKDEADVIAGTLAHMADEVHHLIVADNGSTDGTREILAELATRLPLTVLDDPDVAYHQSHKMTFLARKAAEAGAEWIVPFDADELWIAPQRVYETVEASNANVVTARLFNHFPTAIDPDEKDPFESIVWRQREPGALPKVAFRWHPDAHIHQGNHGVDRPDAVTVEGLEVRHFPYRSAEQFVRKARNGAAAYRATDLPETMGAHWRAYGDILDRYGEEALVDQVFRKWFWFFSPVDAGMVLDPAHYRRWLL